MNIKVNKDKFKYNKNRITKKTLIVNCLSVRALRAVCIYFDVSTEECIRFNVGNLSSIRQDKLLGIKNCGTTTVVEILDVCFEAKIVQGSQF